MEVNLRSSLSQFVTFAFQSQVCLSTSKAKPAGQRTAAKRMAPAMPARSHRTTSRQSPSVDKRKYSSGGLFSQSCSGVWATSLGLSWALAIPVVKNDWIPINFMGKSANNKSFGKTETWFWQWSPGKGVRQWPRQRESRSSTARNAKWKDLISSPVHFSR